MVTLMNEIVRDLSRLPPEPGTTRFGDGLPRRAFTADEVEQMIEAGILRSGDRFELLGGDLVAMAARGRFHEVLKIALNRHWGKACPAELMVAPETALRLDEHWVPEPGFIVYPATTLAPDVRGDTVLLVVEIGDASLADDHRIKAPMYARFGVREYWVINARQRVTTVHRDPGTEGYASQIEVAADGLLEPLLAPALAVRLADLEGG